MGDGREFSGTPLQIVQGMCSIAFNGCRSVGEYIDKSAVMAADLEGVDMKVVGETDEERAESFVAEMVRLGLAKEI